MKKGLFIAMEGGEGVGKTTQTALLYDRIAKEYPQCEVIRSKEPTELIRDLVTQYPLQDITRLYLIAAGRAEAHATLIKPALEEGYIVITDRYVFSSLVYQGHNHYAAVCNAHYHATEGLHADINIVLDMCPEQAMSRMIGELDVLEKAEPEEWERRRQAYLDWGRKLNSVKVIDAHEDINTIHENIWNMIEHMIDNKLNKGGLYDRTINEENM